ncbi:hypothetical protein VB712_06010 [Spirulina sp. CCNP1310]|uniref:hypothetical protein n=1 Tax=Spirulina sp. CCNP1310 TaxID=3110249 RepID=UPI002B20EB37|nr:hypothetical protein [Spirulina sp. CCNP1310]MEA5418774.1 hypothetical protein [Spirulina sp. CCNP1310]
MTVHGASRNENPIVAPNLYLCTYHLREDDTEGATHPLWPESDHLLSHFTTTQLTPHLHFSPARFLLPPSQTALPFTLTAHPEIEGFIQPLQLQDSYALLLNIGYDDETETPVTLDPSILKTFNPNHCLESPLTPSCLGQTLILTLWLTPETDPSIPPLTELANHCYQQLFDQSEPPLSRRSELFGSLIFEYGNPRQPDQSPHVLIWLLQNRQTDAMFKHCFSLVFDLFFYRHKVVKAFHDSRSAYQQLKAYYRSLDPTLDHIQTQIDQAQPDPQNDTYLREIKQHLKQLSGDSLIYDRLLRKMKDLFTTIEINGNNYNDKIDQIAATLGINPSDLSIWQQFGENMIPQFRRQIKADLSYFEQGTGLISQAVASIRAIVEIDQAQCDRAWQQWEKEQDKQLQAQLNEHQETFIRELHEQDRQFHQALQTSRDDAQQQSDDLQHHIEAVGVGIAAGATLVSTSELISKPWAIPSRDRPLLPPHPFIFALLLSFFGSWGAWWIATKLIQGYRWSWGTPWPPTQWIRFQQQQNRRSMQPSDDPQAERGAD